MKWNVFTWKRKTFSELQLCVFEVARRTKGTALELWGIETLPRGQSFIMAGLSAAVTNLSPPNLLVPRVVSPLIFLSSETIFLVVWYENVTRWGCPWLAADPGSNLQSTKPRTDQTIQATTLSKKSLDDFHTWNKKISQTMARTFLEQISKAAEPTIELCRIFLRSLELKMTDQMGGAWQGNRFQAE
jgi:hypothetical protein